MKRILSKIPKKENREDFFKILSREYKINLELIKVLYKFFGENFYFILNIFGGHTIKFPSIDNLNEIGLMLKIYVDIKKMLDYDMDFKKIVDIISKKYSLQQNKVFIYYNRVKHILDDYDALKKTFF